MGVKARPSPVTGSIAYHKHSRVPADLHQDVKVPAPVGAVCLRRQHLGQDGPSLVHQNQVRVFAILQARCNLV